ncbi:MAG: NADH-quinone oxidoreductase subunit N, partial [Bacteroidetes bacterium]|nr:NADH-quinone oxidoreductase subunit N [Bacteroidota bacterium]
ISSYILTGYTKEIKRSTEASMKYVIYGSLASGLMIYGMSLIYGLTGTLNLSTMNFALSFNTNWLTISIAGLMILAGFAYKISAVPFHFWTPDVYEGAPVATTALLSVASKAAGFAVVIRFFAAGFINPANSDSYIWNALPTINWQWVIGILSIITMTLGNLVAVWQNNLKRMLAYSSIAHAGYLLMGVMIMTTAGVESIMFYFITYLLMNFGAFLVVQLVANEINSEDINDYAGLGYRNPVLAATMTIFLASLAGVPPLAGFLGKWYLFNSVIEANQIGIAVIGVLNSVVSLYYYMRVPMYMYFRKTPDTDPQSPISISKPNLIFLLVITIPVVLLVVKFGPLLELARNSAQLLIK